MKVLNQKNNFLGLENEHSSFESSKIVILPVPYEHTVSYGGGTKDGPKAIIDASQYVEFYDIDLDREICFETGIATLKPVSLGQKINEDAIKEIYGHVKKMLDQDKFVVSLGGEHTISSAPIKAHSEKFPDMCVLQFDAHADLREEYEDNKWSHASIMARSADFMNPSKFHQVGIRAICKEERKFIEDYNVNTFFASKIHQGDYGTDWKQKLVDGLSDQIYLTFDVDFFDPSIMPSTGTPEPNGFNYHDTIDIINLIKESGKKIIGMDFVELAPVKGNHHPDILVASLIYKIIGIIHS